MINTIITLVAVSLLLGVCVIIMLDPYYRRQRQARIWMDSHDRGQP